MMAKFDSAFCYKVIYVFEINAETHKGLVKVGDASLYTDNPIDSLAPNSRELNQAALARIKQYTNTAGLTPHLLHTELAIRTVKSADGSLKLKSFRDYDVHRVLVNSGIHKKQIKNTSGKEWFEVDLQTVRKAIDAVKRGQPNFINTSGETFVPIVFRPEQEDAIARTLKQFKTGNRMLWNAKMRFGKTLSALQVVKEAGYARTIIITHRPVVDKGWYEDFGKIFHDGGEYIYGSKNTGADIDYLIDSGKKFVYFASIQDLRGSAVVGGKFDKNDAVFSLDWDLVIVDEAHEGTTTALGDDVIKKLVKDNGQYNTRFLALSGTPFNILKDYDDNIYTWDYVMEQRSKRDWDQEHFGDSNPYDELPELRIYTYDLGKIISEACYVELEDKAFNFREFFRTRTGSLRAVRVGISAGQSVVNMHMSDCLGGYDFFDEAHNERLDAPRFVDRGDVTADTLGNPKLEINSKTGLYPLYVTYSIFRAKCAAYSEAELDAELQEKLWDETVRDNIFVICKTPMAKSITKRTLAGYRDAAVNAHYFDDLVNMLKNRPESFTKKVLKRNYWNQNGGGQSALSTDRRLWRNKRCAYISAFCGVRSKDNVKVRLADYSVTVVYNRARESAWRFQNAYAKQPRYPYAVCLYQLQRCFPHGGDKRWAVLLPL